MTVAPSRSALRDKHPSRAERDFGMRWLRRWGLAICWMVVMWFLSTEVFSSPNTSLIISPFLRWLLPSVSVATIQLLHTVIRKSAHFTEFFVFSLLLLGGIRGERRVWNVGCAVWAIAIAACYAAIDEAHQLFVPYRGASLLDFLLDSSAAAAAQLLAWLRMRWQSRNSHTDKAQHLTKPLTA